MLSLVQPVVQITSDVLMTLAKFSTSFYSISMSILIFFPYLVAISMNVSKHNNETKFLWMLVQEAIDNFNIIKPYIVEILENTKYLIFRTVLMIKCYLINAIFISNLNNYAYYLNMPYLYHAIFCVSLYNWRFFVHEFYFARPLWLL